MSHWIAVGVFHPDPEIEEKPAYLAAQIITKLEKLLEDASSNYFILKGAGILKNYDIDTKELDKYSGTYKDQLLKEIARFNKLKEEFEKFVNSKKLKEFLDVSRENLIKYVSPDGEHVTIGYYGFVEYSRSRLIRHVHLGKDIKLEDILYTYLGSVDIEGLEIPSKYNASEWLLQFLQNLSYLADIGEEKEFQNLKNFSVEELDWVVDNLLPTFNTVRAFLDFIKHKKDFRSLLEDLAWNYMDDVSLRTAWYSVIAHKIIKSDSAIANTQRFGRNIDLIFDSTIFPVKHYVAKKIIDTVFDIFKDISNINLEKIKAVTKEYTTRYVNELGDKLSKVTTDEVLEFLRYASANIEDLSRVNYHRLYMYVTFSLTDSFLDPFFIDRPRFFVESYELNLYKTAFEKLREELLNYLKSRLTAPPPEKPPEKPTEVAPTEEKPPEKPPEEKKPPEKLPEKPPEVPPEKPPEKSPEKVLEEMKEENLKKLIKTLEALSKYERLAFFVQNYEKFDFLTDKEKEEILLKIILVWTDNDFRRFYELYPQKVEKAMELFSKYGISAPKPIKLKDEEKRKLKDYFVSELSKYALDVSKYLPEFEKVIDIYKTYDENKTAVDNLLKRIISEIQKEKPKKRLTPEEISRLEGFFIGKLTGYQVPNPRFFLPQARSAINPEKSFEANLVELETLADRIAEDYRRRPERVEVTRETMEELVRRALPPPVPRPEPTELPKPKELVPPEKAREIPPEILSRFETYEVSIECRKYLWKAWEEIEKLASIYVSMSRVRFPRDIVESAIRREHEKTIRKIEENMNLFIECECPNFAKWLETVKKQTEGG